MSEMTEKKKILFAITKGNWGGAQRYVFDLATNLPKDRFEICVVCGEGNKLVEKLRAQNIRVIQLDSLKRDIRIGNEFKTFGRFYEILKKEKPDIIHLNSSKIGAVGALAGRYAGVPKIIFTGHGWAWNENRAFISKFLITTIHWLTVFLSHTTIAVSEKVKRQILKLPFLNPSKIAVIHNGIQTIDYLERFAARAKLDGQITEKFWVGTISELHTNKGLDTLIVAFAEIAKVQNDVVLVIIGEGEERKSLTTLIEKNGLSKKIHLLGFVENAQTFLKAFDVFVLASRTEAFPYVLLEAGLAQLPVVATSVGGVPEVITEHKNGLLIPPEQTGTLSRAIKELLENSAGAATFGHNLRKTVENSFSVSTMVEKTLDVYNRI